jgi:hypothetical protein
MLICPFITGRLYQHRLTMVDQNLKLVPVNSGRLNKMIRAGGVFALVHSGLSVCSKRVRCESIKWLS